MPAPFGLRELNIISRLNVKILVEFVRLSFGCVYCEYPVIQLTIAIIRSHNTVKLADLESQAVLAKNSTDINRVHLLNFEH